MHKGFCGSPNAGDFTLIIIIGVMMGVARSGVEQSIFRGGATDQAGACAPVANQKSCDGKKKSCHKNICIFFWATCSKNFRVRAKV